MKKFQKKLIKFLILAILIFFVIYSSIQLEVKPFDLSKGFSNFLELIDEAFPPDTSLIKTAWIGIFETIQIAFLGTVFGSIIALPLGLLASRNLFKKQVTIPIRVFLAVIRTMPSLLWAIIFVIMVGLGPFSGVMAMTMYTVGYLGKNQYEAIEGINNEALEALSGIGTTKIQLIRFVVLPEAANILISQILFMFDYNIRASSILGFVGAGGIGFYIMGYLKFLEYNKVFTLLIFVLFTVLIVDYLSVKIRDRYLCRD